MTTTLEERKQCQKNMQQCEKSNPTLKKHYAIHKQEQEQCQANNKKNKTNNNRRILQDKKQS